jgi:DNA-binding MarR family transcriptional regulator
VVTERLPLSALLSQALVAFTIELDNAFEQRMAVWTTGFGGRRSGSVWGTSLRQWSNFMRLVDADGVTVAELERRARAAPALDGMRRWRYVTIGPDPQESRSRVPERELIVAPTAAGARAQEVWRPLPAEIEARWRERFGGEVIDALGGAAVELIAGLGLALPEWMTGYYGGFANGPVDNGDPPTPPELLPLSALLSQPLQAFALEYEDGLKVSLCFTANVLRVLDAAGVRPRDLPARSGVASPALQTALGILAKRTLVVLKPDPSASRGKLAALTERGACARAAYEERTAKVEADWRSRFGDQLIDTLRSTLEPIVVGEIVVGDDEGPGEHSPLFAGLEPPPGSWRSKTKQLPVLPHYPMPRQGGHPDGV